MAEAGLEAVFGVAVMAAMGWAAAGGSEEPAEMDSAEAEAARGLVAEMAEAGLEAVCRVAVIAAMGWAAAVWEAEAVGLAEDLAEDLVARADSAVAAGLAEDLVAGRADSTVAAGWAGLEVLEAG